MTSPLLHLITDAEIERGQLLDAIRAAVENGADWVQVRDHRAAARDLLDLTADIIAVCRPRGVRVAVNDRVDVALAVGADGVQLGGRSLPIGLVRQVAPALEIGASVHGVETALAAEANGADWITFGHVYATPSHPDEPPRGLAVLEQVARSVKLPVIAIGGIGNERVGDVLAAGAAGIAVISAILRAADPAIATADLRRLLR